MKHMASMDAVCSVVLMVLLTGGAAGCGDQCTAGQTRCNGNTAQFCEEEDSDDPTLIWYSQDCGEAFCRPISDPNDGSHALCAQAAEPDPRCAGADNLEFCEGDVVVGCLYGYVVYRANCTTGVISGKDYMNWSVSPGFCISDRDWARCLPEPTPNPLCAAAPYGEVCDGSQVVGCAHGYLTGFSQCPTGGTCVPTPAGNQLPGDTANAFCSLAQSADPWCPPDMEYYDFCRDGGILACSYGWLVRQVEQCPVNTTCVVMDGVPSCW